MSDHFHNLIRVLAVLVTVQAIFVIDKLTFFDKQPSLEDIARKQAIAYTQLPQNEVFLQETDRKDISLAKFSSQVEELDSQIKVDIYIDSQQTFNTANLLLDFDPQEIQIIDQDVNLPGIQLGLGDLDIYLQNQVDNRTGKIQLLAKNSLQKNQKTKVATLYLRKLNSDRAKINFEYDANSFQKTFVKAKNIKTNILSKPESILIP